MRRLLCALLLVTFVQAQFEDIPPEHWAEGAVTRLVELGVITGFPDGNFHGTQGVTRYEVSLMLARLWDAWNTEALSDVWSELVGVQTQLTSLQEERELLEVTVQDLQGRIDQVEGYLVELDSRTADVQESQQSLEGVAVGLEELRSQLTTVQEGLESLANLQEQLQASVEAQRAEALEPQVQPIPDFGVDIAALEAKVAEEIELLKESVTNAQNEFTKRLDDVTLVVTALADEQEAKAWQGQLSVAAGFSGRAPSFSFGTIFKTSSLDFEAEASSFGVRLDLTANLSSGFGLTGRVLSQQGVAASVGPSVFLSPAISASVFVGVDGGLAFTGVLRHARGKADSFLPGLDVMASVVLAENDQGVFERWLIQAGVSYLVDSGTYYLRPGVLYRRSMSEDYQIFVPELGVGFLVGETLIAATVRYGFLQQLSGGGRSIPEGNLSVIFANGAVTKISVEGGLPELGEVASFATGNLLEPKDVTVGVSVGYTLQLETLFK